MNSILKYSAVIFAIALGAGCGTTDGELRQAGRGDSYVMGFHDGRHSGLKEAGNNYEHYIQDTARFDTDAEYRDGWIAGEEEGKRLQAQAQALGNSAAGSYSGSRVGREVDKSAPDPDAIAKDVMKDVDTSELKVLEK